MSRETNVSPAVVYACAALLLGLYLMAEFVAFDPAPPGPFTSDAQRPVYVTYVEEHL